MIDSTSDFVGLNFIPFFWGGGFSHTPLRTPEISVMINIALRYYWKKKGERGREYVCACVSACVCVCV